MYYDREGNQISMDEWINLREDQENRFIDRDVINGFLISTVWIGLDHQFGDGPPLVFETMVFDQREKENWEDIFCKRASTEEQAREAHQEAVHFVQTLESA